VHFGQPGTIPADSGSPPAYQEGGEAEFADVAENKLRREVVAMLVELNAATVFTAVA
jgi:hypothetical protein